MSSWLTLTVTGVMGYYQAQLNDLIQYPDLRTEVFQSFREVGNAILFCMLVEQSLVSYLPLHFLKPSAEIHQ